MSSIPRSHYRFFGVAAAALVVAGTLAVLQDGGSRTGDATHADERRVPTVAIPEDALLVVAADLVALRSSGLGDRLRAESRDVPGLGDLRAACGFDPYESFDAAAFAVPGGGADGDFGISVTGHEVGGAQLLACTTKVIAARGGKPLTSKLGSFQTVRDVASGAAAGEIAAREGGPFLLGAGSYLRTMVDAADGRVPSVREGAHARLVAALAGAPVATATLVLGRRQRQAIAEEIASAGGAAPAAIGKVAAAAVGLEAQGDRVGLHVVAQCDDGRSALDVANALEELRTRRADSPLARLSGIASILGAVHVEVEREIVHARLVMSRKDADVLLTLLLGSARAPGRPDASGPPADEAPTGAASAASPPTSSASAPASPRAPRPRAKPKDGPPGPSPDELEEF